MHPYILHQLASARVADMHSQAERQRIVGAARRARRAPQRPAAQPIAGPGSLLRRVLPSLLATHGQRRQPGPLDVQAPHGLRT